MAAPRWDRINSAAVIGRARQIYYAYLQSSAGGNDPCGIVLSGPDGPQGRVVFDPPVLLPEEQFIPLDLVRGRQGRGRPPRSFTRG
ncbi:MAG: hypothetical protein VKJ66_09900 [Synechococcus sp.]|nr:hypothetical protein [Synechococcus sp.]